jgi:hypothetical protein
MMKNTLQAIEEEILFIGQQLNDDLFEQYNSGEITLQQLEDAYRILSQWSTQSEGLLNLLN